MIRKMKDSELDQVCELEKKLFSHPWRRIDFNYELTENPFSHYVVEEENGEIVAYLGLWLDENQIQITTLGVNEDYQRQGYAKKLMDYLFDFSQKNKVVTLSLEVRESNFKAINLYEYFHFKKAAIRKNYYSHPDEDGILMICNMKGDFSHENISR